MIFLFPGPGNGVYLVALIPLFIGVGLIAYTQLARRA